MALSPAYARNSVADRFAGFSLPQASAAPDDSESLVNDLHNQKRAVLLQLMTTRDPNVSAGLHRQLEGLDTRLSLLQGTPTPDYSSLADASPSSDGQSFVSRLLGSGSDAAPVGNALDPISHASPSGSGPYSLANLLKLHPLEPPTLDQDRENWITRVSNPSYDGALDSASNYGNPYLLGGQLASGTPDQAAFSRMDQKAMAARDPKEQFLTRSNLDLLGLPSALTSDAIKLGIGVGTNTLDKPEVLKYLNQAVELGSLFVPGISTEGLSTGGQNFSDLLNGVSNLRSGLAESGANPELFGEYFAQHSCGRWRDFP